MALVAIGPRGPQLTHNGDVTASECVYGDRRDGATLSGNSGGGGGMRDRSNELSQRAKIG